MSADPLMCGLYGGSAVQYVKRSGAVLREDGKWGWERLRLSYGVPRRALMYSRIRFSSGRAKYLLLRTPTLPA